MFIETPPDESLWKRLHFSTTGVQISRVAFTTSCPNFMVFLCCALRILGALCVAKVVSTQRRRGTAETAEELAIQDNTSASRGWAWKHLIVPVREFFH